MLTPRIQTLFMACNTEDGLETWRTFHVVRHDCTPSLLRGIPFPSGQGQISPKRGFLPYKKAGMREAHRTGRPPACRAWRGWPPSYSPWRCCGPSAPPPDWLSNHRTWAWIDSSLNLLISHKNNLGITIRLKACSNRIQSRFKRCSNRVQSLFNPSSKPVQTEFSGALGCAPMSAPGCAPKSGKPIKSCAFNGERERLPATWFPLSDEQRTSSEAEGLLAPGPSLRTVGISPAPTRRSHLPPVSGSAVCISTG